MVQIQFDIETSLDKNLRLYMAENDISRKSEAIKIILREKFSVSVRQGLRNLMK